MTDLASGVDPSASVFGGMATDEASQLLASDTSTFRQRLEELGTGKSDPTGQTPTPSTTPQAFGAGSQASAVPGWVSQVLVGFLGVVILGAGLFMLSHGDAPVRQAHV